MVKQVNDPKESGVKGYVTRAVKNQRVWGVVIVLIIAVIIIANV